MFFGGSRFPQLEWRNKGTHLNPAINHAFKIARKRAECLGIVCFFRFVAIVTAKPVIRCVFRS